MVIKVETPPVINDGIHKALLSNPGSKIVWTSDAISFMSNISNTGDVFAVKTRSEKYLQDTNSLSGQQSITQVDIDAVINSKPEMNQFYSTTVTSECDPHFHACFKVAFHPLYE